MPGVQNECRCRQLSRCWHRCSTRSALLFVLWQESVYVAALHSSPTSQYMPGAAQSFPRAWVAKNRFVNCNQPSTLLRLVNCARLHCGSSLAKMCGLPGSLSLLQLLLRLNSKAYNCADQLLVPVSTKYEADAEQTMSLDNKGSLSRCDKPGEKPE